MVTHLLSASVLYISTYCVDVGVSFFAGTLCGIVFFGESNSFCVLPWRQRHTVLQMGMEPRNWLGCGICGAPLG